MEPISETNFDRNSIKSQKRPPRIGQIPRHSAFDDGPGFEEFDDGGQIRRTGAAGKYRRSGKDDGGASLDEVSGSNSENVVNSGSKKKTSVLGDCSALDGPISASDRKTSKKYSTHNGMATTTSGQPQVRQKRPSEVKITTTTVKSKGETPFCGSAVPITRRTSGNDIVKKLGADLKISSSSCDSYNQSSKINHNNNLEASNSSPKSSACSSTQSAPIPDQSSMVTLNAGVPIPAKCSEQLRKLIHSHSISQPPAGLQGSSSGGSSLKFDGASSVSSLDDDEPEKQQDNHKPSSRARGLPYQQSLQCSSSGPSNGGLSPASSPRIRRKPLRETNRVNSITDSGEYLQLNQYKLEDNIGMGSYGIVKLAYNKEDDSHYAMKILSKKKLKRKAGFFAPRGGLPNRKAGPSGATRKMAEDPLQKVYREIAIMKKLDHPNVVKLVEVLDDPEDENLYMAFELLEGGEVLQIPTDEPMDEKAAWLAFRDVILGLEYLHWNKIIHRDIKPSNLLRTTTGEVKIADLGVSNEFAGADAFLTNTAGTPAFTPPESLAHKPGDEPFSGRAADIWSLGVTLYCLVVGRVPFFDENILSLYNKIRTQPFPFPEDKDLSPELSDLITRMLVKDPNERIALPEVKAHDWVTGLGLYPLPTEEENCELIEITDLDVDNSVRTVPKLDTLILVKTMIKNRTFTNPFNSIKNRFVNNGRSNSAPEVSFPDSDRKLEALRRKMPILCEEEKSDNEGGESGKLQQEDLSD